MLTIAGYLGLSQAISAQFALEMQPKIVKKITKNFYFGVQGHSGSLIMMSIERAYETFY